MKGGRGGHDGSPPCSGLDGASLTVLTLLCLVCQQSALHTRNDGPSGLAWHLQERADDEHTNRGMRLVQLEQDAMSKGYPLGDGIGLFGVGSSALAGSEGGAGSKGRAAALSSRPGSSMELNASANSASRGRAAGAGTSGR